MKHQDIIAKEPWHALRAEEIFSELKTSEKGLSEVEAKKRLRFYGENTLPEGKKVTPMQIILHQLSSPLIFILIAAAVASVAIGEGKDAIFIFLVIFINSALGAYQEYNAEKSASSLQKLMRIKARVRRDGKEKEVPSEELVPGDIVLLESGMKVPADMRLLEVSGLEIDESFLTGESIATKKQIGVLQENLGVAERTNMAFAGSTVVRGRGVGVVVCTGVDTQVGKISQDVAESASAKPPLVLRMERFITQISIFIVALSAILAVILRARGMDFASIFFFVVALAVSAVPEGLPVALTVALSIAAKRMTKRNVIVRKLTSVESLGSCTVIASDKTGTLTVNEQTAKIIQLPNGSHYTIEGQGYNGEGKVVGSQGKPIDVSENHEIAQIARIAIFANEGSLIKENSRWSYHGDAMDVALLGMGYKLGVNPEKWVQEEKMIGRIPYESERKFSAALCKVNGSVFIRVKGAVETILNFCTTVSVNGEIQPIDKEKILLDAAHLAKDGYRVLAFASGEYKEYQKRKYIKTKISPHLHFTDLWALSTRYDRKLKKRLKNVRKLALK